MNRARLLTRVVLGYLVMSSRSTTGAKAATVAAVPNMASSEGNHQYGGENTSIDEFPWFTAIIQYEHDKFTCGGALIGARYVVTAGHCIESPISAYVEVGYWCRQRQNCGRSADVVGVRSLFRHRSSNGGPVGDMVLLELDRSVNFSVQPAVPFLGNAVHPKQRTLTKNRKLLMVGAGREGENSNISLFVKKLQLRYLPRKECRKRLTDPSLVNEHVVCSTAVDGGPCRGDSGSAVIVPGRDVLMGRDVIMAIHSFGPNRCFKGENKAFGHFRMEDAAELVQTVVCEGDYPEDWCGKVGPEDTSHPTATPSNAPPTQAPTDATEPQSLKVTLLHSLLGHQGKVFDVAFNGDGSRLLSCGAESKVRIWNVKTGGKSMSKSFTKKGHFCNSVQWDPVSGSVFAAASGQRIHVGSVDDSSSSSTFSKHIFGRANSIGWREDGEELIVANDLHVDVLKWKRMADRKFDRIQLISGATNSVTYHPNGTEFAAGLDSGDIQIHVRGEGRVPYKLSSTFQGHTASVEGVAYSRDGRFLASASKDKSAMVWDLETGTLRFKFLHTDRVAALAWSPSGRFLVTGSRNREVRFWDMEKNGTDTVVLDGHDGQITSVDWSSDGAHVVSASLDSRVIIWRVEGEGI